MVVVTAAMQMTLRFQQTKNIPDALVSNEKENEP